MIKLFLDDMRDAPDKEWVVVRSVAAAQDALRNRAVYMLSLDHDLGACGDCIRTNQPGAANLMHCHHVPTGYDLVKWMVENDVWPVKKPLIHSMNPVGRANMKAQIDRWGPYR
jgi:hypothetical protein